MASVSGSALTDAKAALIKALRAGGAATTKAGVLEAADAVAKATARIAALERIGMMHTKLHAV